jgi:CSLREA domain-containing protein
VNHPSSSRARLAAAWSQRKSGVLWSVLLGLLPLLVAAGGRAAVSRPQPAAPPTFTVNSTADAVAAAPLDDGICDTGLVLGQPNGTCTLRAAVMKANHWPGGGVTIILPPQAPGVVYALDIPAAFPYDEASGDLNVTNTVSLVGSDASRTIIDGSDTGDRILTILPTGIVTLTRVTLDSSHPITTATGSAIFNYGGTLTLIRSGVVGNHSDSEAGGITNYGGVVSIYTSTVAGNTGATGGGLNNVAGTLLMVDSLLSGNHSKYYGGGLYNAGVTADLVNTTVSGNDAIRDGGGIYNVASTTVLSLYNVTIANNRADLLVTGNGTGGGIENRVGFSATVHMRNTLIADNYASVNILSVWSKVQNDCSGALLSSSYNLVEFMGDDCTLTGGAGDQTNVAAHLGLLQDNGGPTFSHALLPGSPAIDAGNPGGCTGFGAMPLRGDQRGRPRTANGAGATRCDIGAFELQRLLNLPLVLK